MSILLEALRKSEKNQRQHETPTIHSDDQSGLASEPLPTGLLVVVLLTGLFVSGWFAWRQYQPPAGSDQPPATLSAENASTDSKPALQDKEPAQLTPASPTVSVSQAQQRTPVESYQPAVIDDSSSNPSAQETPAEGSQPPVDTSTSNGQAGTDAAVGARPSRVASNTVSSAQPAETAEEQFHPGEPAPIGYWDLPDAVRSEVPVIKFSVLVYAANPADRFVLINGQRLAEGDTAGPGLVVKEIQRDGVVFSYRLYQFLVER